MTIELDHTFVWCRDKVKSPTLLVELPGAAV